MSLTSVLNTAESQLGITEWPKGSNKVIYNTEYYGKPVSGDAYPWCVVFLWWVFKTAGESKAFFNNGKTASCSVLKRLYVEEGLYLNSGNYIPGDIAFLTFSSNRDISHCGLIVGIDEQGNYITIEGNTTPGQEGSQDNGGCVAKKIRSLKNIVGVARPRYSAEKEEKKDYEGHWAEKDILWALKMGIASGYPDGSFRPDAQLTRAEAVVLLHNLTKYISNHFSKNGLGTL